MDPDRVVTVRPTRIHYGWIVLGTVMLMLLAPSGIRSSFGVFIRPMDYVLAFHSAALTAFAATVMVLAIRERSAAGPRTVVAPAAGA